MSQLLELATPFNEKLVQRKPGNKGGDYVSHSSITERALSIVGAYSLGPVELIRGYAPEEKTKSATYPAQENVVVGALVTIRCVVDGREVSVTEAGDVENPLQKSNDGARAKDAISDGVKRCWMRLGLALHLWSQDDYFLHKLLTRNEAEIVEPESVPKTPEPVAPTVKTDEPVKATERATENVSNGVVISAAAATRLKKKIADLGLSYPNETTFIESALGMGSLEEFAELNQAQASAVWTYAASEAAKAETKEVWESWADDSGATAWAASLSNEHGIFRGGHELMTAWAEVKTKVRNHENLYPLWYAHVSDLIVEKNKKAA